MTEERCPTCGRRKSGAPATQRRIERLEIDRIYTVGELRAHDIYAGILTTALRHGYLERVERGRYRVVAQ